MTKATKKKKTAPGRLRYGAHLSPGDLEYTSGIISLCGCRAMQIFISNPRSFHPATSERSAKNLSALRGAGELELTVHMPYVVNLASADESLREKSVEHVISAMEASAAAGASYYVVHPGSGAQEAMRLSVDAIHRATRGCPVTLLIENTEGSGNKLFHDFDGITGFMRPYGKDVGVCWDTAHAFGAGVDTLAMPPKLRELVRVVHLNDSKVPFGSKKDRHAAYGEGLIGGGTIERIVRMFGAGVTYIIEREGYENTCADLAFLRDLKI